MKDMLFLCIERMFGLTNGCRNLERVFFQVSYYDPRTQYRKGWGSFQIKGRLTLCYNCRRPGHLAKECLGKRPSCLCFQAMDHEVLDFHRMIAKVERMNIRQENPKEYQETKTMEEP
jgi:hypothetical protein